MATKDFSQYLAEARAKYGVTAAKTTAAKPLNLSAFSQSAEKKAGDPLSTLVDILSRPMRAIENIPNQAFNEMLKAEQASKTGKAYDVWGGIGNVVTAAPRGFFSNNPEDQPTGAQLIEKGTDAFGQLNSRNYKDVQDNVNPWVKGIGGFGLDVGLDPLTYIPGAQLAKGAQLVGKGIKGAAELADLAVAGTKAGEVLGATNRVASREALKVSQTAAINDIIKSSKEATRATLGHSVNQIPEGIDMAAIQRTLAEAPQLAKAAKVTETVAPTIEKVAAAAKGVQAATRGPSAAEDLATSILDKSAAKAANAAKLSEALTAQWAAKPEAKAAVEAALAKFTPSVPVEAKVAAATVAEPTVDVAQQISKLEADKAKIQERISYSKSDTAYATGTVKINAIDAQIKGLKAQQKISAKLAPVAAGATEKAAKRFTTSNALNNILKDPAAVAQVKAAFGEDAFSKILNAKGNSAKITKAIDHITRMVSGDIATNSKVNKELIHDIMATHDIKVPGTNVTSTVGVAAVDTSLTKEIALEKAQGHTLPEAPRLWPGNYSPHIVDEVVEDMPSWLKNDFVNLEGYFARTRRQALSTSATKGEGLHKFPYELNQWDQWTLTERLVARDRARLKAHNEAMVEANTPGAMVAGEQRANEIMDAMFQKIELGMRVMDRKGAAAWMGEDLTRFRLYHHQMLAALRDSSVGDVLRIAVFNEPSSVPMTNIMDAVTAIFRNPNISDKELMAELTKVVEGADNFLTGKYATARWKHYIEKPKNGLWEPNVKEGKLKGYYGLVTKEQVAKDLLETIKKSAPTIQKVVAHNEEMAAARWLAESRDIPKSLFDDLTADANDPKSFGDFIRKIANTVTSSNEHAVANLVTPQMQGFLAKAVTDYMGPAILHDSQHIAKIQKAADSWMNLNLETSLRNLGLDEVTYLKKQSKGTVLARKDITEGVGPDGTVIDEVAYENAVAKESFAAAIDNAVVSPAAKAFRYQAGMEKVIHDFDRTDTVIHAANTRYYLETKRIMEKYGTFIKGTETTVLTQAFRDLANGVDNLETAAARAELEPMILEIMGNPKQANALGIWQRAHASLDDIQLYMKKAKMDFPIDMSIAREAAADGDLVKAGLDQWKTWAATIDNPMKFLTDMHHAASMLLVDNTAANLFLKLPNVVSDKAAKGFTKIGKLDPYAHPLLSRMPENTYVSDEIIGQVNNLEQKIMADLSPKSEFGKWINNHYIPLLGIWKKGVTIYRPGHHIRNLLSSEGIQYTVEGTRHYARSGTAAIKVLMTHKAYKGVSWAEIAGGKEIADMPKGSDLLFTFGNKKVTVADLYNAAEGHGLFTDFKHIEDLFDTPTTGPVTEFLNKVSFKDKPIEKFAGGLSEYQAHFSRLHHFTQILMKQGKKGTNWEEAIRSAATKVKRHHPDGLTLTNFEKKYLKPLIPFYSWFRQILPVVAEGIVTHPGRFMQYPKASYNLAVAMGVNPQSLQDPFPADQLFPSFITDQLTGPVANLGGNYYTASPGYAYADVLNQFVADPKKGLVSMVTPFIKTPGEILTGTKWDTGSKINDFSDYVDSQIPGVNYVANFSGTSVTGSLGSLLTGYGLDSQYAVDKGNKTVWDQGIAASNWVTGAGVSNVSKPSLIKLAEIQRRDAAKRAAEEAAGTARSPF